MITNYLDLSTLFMCNNKLSEYILLEVIFYDYLKTILLNFEISFSITIEILSEETFY